jgi:hypothetical protein
MTRLTQTIPDINFTYNARRIQGWFPRWRWEVWMEIGSHNIGTAGTTMTQSRALRKAQELCQEWQSVVYNADSLRKEKR